VLLAAMALAGCGGGDEKVLTGPASCSVRDRTAWLSDYMDDWYFWYDIAPHPSSSGYSTVESYFEDLLLRDGDSRTFPADRWSYISDTADYNRFCEDGETVGYGVMVAGLEVTDQPDEPLRIRYIEPGSPADDAGLQRGDRILSMNGVAASTIIANDDYSDLSATDTGETLTLEVVHGGVTQTITLRSAVYDLVPVTGEAVYETAGGKLIGYLQVKDMVDQALDPLDDAFADFRREGIDELALDLRYNGGGLVSVAQKIASYVAANRTDNEVFAKLLYNDKRADTYNTTFRFNDPGNALSLERVYVLTGPRTCSASELVINALRPYVQVVTIGDTTCGKPVGFLPRDDGCGSTFSAVNFESVNAENEGRYFDGFDASCAVADDLDTAQGATDDALLVAAADHADYGGCPETASSSRAQPYSVRAGAQRKVWDGEPGDRHGSMIIR